jgi:hypothetical protein
MPVAEELGTHSVADARKCKVAYPTRWNILLEFKRIL